jgi:hypothetical protein
LEFQYGTIGIVHNYTP